MSENEEEREQTMEERERWLRARGVEIETCEDRLREEMERKRAPLKVGNEENRGREGDDDDESQGVDNGRDDRCRWLVCVRIPCDANEAFEEVKLKVAIERHGDVFPDLGKPFFVGGGLIDVNMAQDAAMKQLGAEFAQKSSNLGVALQKETAMGSTETFALVRPSEKNGRRGVYIYLDEVGLLKGKPRNDRASSLASSAGFSSVSFHGDVFVGAVKTEPQPMRSVDFYLHEMDSSAKWLKLAPMENAEYSLSMKELENAMNTKNGAGMQRINMGGGTNDIDGDGQMPSGDGEGYRWEQTEDEVEISVYVPENVTAKEIKVGFNADSICVKNKQTNAEIIKIENLFKKIRPDECTWTIGKTQTSTRTLDDDTGYVKCVVLSLAKITEGESWPDLQK